MKPSPKLRPNGWDLLAAGVVLALAAGCGLWLWGGSGGAGELTAVVSIDGGEVERFSLFEGEERTYHANGYTLLVRSTAGGVEMAASDCPTQDCVRTGTISRGGQSIVCLPARLSVQLVGDGGEQGGVDLVIG